MAYTVTPTTNQVTGEVGEATVSTSLHHGTPNQTHTSQTTEDEEVFEPFEPAESFINALSEDKAKQLTSALLQSGKELTGSEISFIQDRIFNAKSTDEKQYFARLLDARVTGNTNDLMPDEFDVLGIQPPNPDLATAEEIDNIILTTDYKPDSALASRVLSTDIGQSDAAVVVKHLAYAVYDGQLSAQQAYAKAFRSGVPHEQLYQAFNDLSDGVNQ